jgi:hypothetical protein
LAENLAAERCSPFLLKVSQIKAFDNLIFIVRGVVQNNNNYNCPENIFPSLEGAFTLSVYAFVFCIVHFQGTFAFTESVKD